MKGSTHLAAGLMSGVLAQAALGIEANTLGALWPVLATGVAALAPDWMQINVPGMNQIVKGLSGHRGFSHWLLTAMATWWLLRSLLPNLALFVLAGWVSHILLDLFAGGVPALFPLPRITLANIKTGGKMDTLAGAACCVIASAIIIRSMV